MINFKAFKYLIIITGLLIGVLAYFYFNTVNSKDLEIERLKIEKQDLIQQKKDLTITVNELSKKHLIEQDSFDKILDSLLIDAGLGN